MCQISVVCFPFAWENCLTKSWDRKSNWLLLSNYFLAACVQSGLAFPEAERSPTPPSLLHHVLDWAEGVDGHSTTPQGHISSQRSELEDRDTPTSLPAMRPWPAEGSRSMVVLWVPSSLTALTAAPGKALHLQGHPASCWRHPNLPFLDQSCQAIQGEGGGKTPGNSKEKRESEDYSSPDGPTNGTRARQGNGMAPAKPRARTKKENLQKVVQKMGYNERRKCLSKWLISVKLSWVSFCVYWMPTITMCAQTLPSLMPTNLSTSCLCFYTNKLRWHGEGGQK